jgi:hypothetical protein
MNVWLAPFASEIFDDLISLRQRMRSRRQAHGQDGNPRVWSLIMSTASSANSFIGPSKRRSTIRPSPILPANLVGYA